MHSPDDSHVSATSAAHAPAGILEGLARQAGGMASPGGLARDSVIRARASQAVLKAFTCINPAAPDPEAAGPLAGIPIGVKDLMATADMVTASGSPIFADHVPVADAWVVARLRSLGAFVTGKTVTTEFAWRHPGPTGNPWNPAHTPGGSSSGSAAAVAAGIVSAALGTQTLGSIVRPAAFCGVVGMKPSRGAIARTGIRPLSGSMDHVGVFARSVSDAGYLLSWLIGTDHADRHGEPLPGFSISPQAGVVALERPRFALLHTVVFDRASAAQKAVLENAAVALRAAGAVVESLELPAAFDAVWTDTMTLIDAESAVIHGPLCDRYPNLVSDHVHGLVERGRQLRAETYLQAHARQQVLRAVFTDVIGDYDCVLTLPAAGEAPAGLDDTGDGSFCAPWSFLGVPAITMPAALSANGLPLGVQLVGAYRNDLRLLRAARWCETVLGFTAVCPRRY
jgi:Asp-tRNA(Asn)/Glu-tRNA(Gln) amidotransferase A subunit family amidase